ncbi:hypothetical protein [Nocardia sp. JMUB6875]|uniref:hypothetical protein n=1 Tax=Nocardia sp. JMUB6875 TaxID=3158170 RepID=UPI0034E8B1ED
MDYVMRSLRTFGATAAATVLALGLSACNDETAPVATPVSSPTVATTKAPVDATTLGPTGYRGIDLGMNWEQESNLHNQGKPIGVLANGGTMQGCARFSYWTKGSGWLKDGVVVAVAPEEGAAVHTPEGIKAGSTLDEVKSAYPSLKFGANWSSAEVPGHPGTHYGFMGIYKTDVRLGQTVTSMLMYSDQDSCHN